MTDGIGRLSGYGNYGVGGYVPQRRGGEESAQENAQEQQVVPNNEGTQIDPSKVMDFLANNNVFIGKTNQASNAGIAPVSQEVADRVAGYMENFETIYAIIDNEFGAELAPSVMDAVMDRLMGMA